MRILHPQKQGQAFLSHAFPLCRTHPARQQIQIGRKIPQAGQGTKALLPHLVYAGLVEEVDGQVGRIVRTLDAQGLTDDTMVVFTSDNGGLISATTIMNMPMT